MSQDDPFFIPAALKKIYIHRKKDIKAVIISSSGGHNLFDKIKINKDFLIFPGSETKLKSALELNNSGIISAICNVTASLACKVYDDLHNKKAQTFNERLCAFPKVFDKNNLISGLHSFMSIEDEKYKTVLPPLTLLSEAQQKEMMSKLKSLKFFPEKNIAA